MSDRWCRISLIILRRTFEFSKPAAVAGARNHNDSIARIIRVKAAIITAAATTASRTVLEPKGAHHLKTKPTTATLIKMARKIRRVCEDAVYEVYGIRRVHRAGSRTCVFCANYHPSDNTSPDSAAATNTAEDMGVEIPGLPDNTILRNDTTVTMLTISLPQHAGLNLFVGEENLNRAIVPSVHAFTLTEAVNPYAVARSPSNARPNSNQRYRVLLTFTCRANTTLP